MLVYLLNSHAEVIGDVWGRGTVGGGASAVRVHQGDGAVACRGCGPSSSHSQSRGDRDIG
jgi:hypothetical protein